MKKWKDYSGEYGRKKMKLFWAHEFVDGDMHGGYL